MYVYGLYGKTKYVKQMKSGWRCSISLGLDKGFATVKFYPRNGWDVPLKDGINIMIPKGDLSIEKYEDKSGIWREQVTITTSFLELVQTKEERATTFNKNDDSEKPIIRTSDTLDNLNNKEKEVIDDAPWELDL